MAVVGDYHFPCIIYMREQGNPIGKIDENVRLERQKWMNNTDCYKDPYSNLLLTISSVNFLFGTFFNSISLTERCGHL